MRDKHHDIYRNYIINRLHTFRRADGNAVTAHAAGAAFAGCLDRIPPVDAAVLFLLAICTGGMANIAGYGTYIGIFGGEAALQYYLPGIAIAALVTCFYIIKNISSGDSGKNTLLTGIKEILSGVLSLPVSLVQALAGIFTGHPGSLIRKKKELPAAALIAPILPLAVIVILLLTHGFGLPLMDRIDPVAAALFGFITASLYATLTVCPGKTVNTLTGAFVEGIRAVAMGATELRKSERIAKAPDAEELRSIAARSMELPEESVTGAAAVGRWHIFDGLYTEKLFGLFPAQKHKVRVLDRNGIICLRREGLGAVVTSRDNLREDLQLLLEDTTEFGTTGGQLPGLFAYYGEKQLDLSGLASPEQVFAVLEIELVDVPDNETIVILAVR